MKRIFKVLIVLFAMILLCTTIFAKSGQEHVKDMIDGIKPLVKDGDEQKIKDTLDWISKHVIDDDTGPGSANSFRSKLKEIAEKYAKEHNQKAILIPNHRDLFHWGFSDDIPFNSGGLKKYLSQYDPKTRNEVKKMIVEEWKNRVNDAVKKVEETFPDIQKYRNPQTGRNTVALAYASYFDDIHLIGDLTTSQGKELLKEDKDRLRRLEKDLLKNLKKIYKDKDPQLVKDVEESFLKARNNPQKVLAGLKKAVKDADKRSGGNNITFKFITKVIDNTEKISKSKGIVRDISRTISEIGKQYSKLPDEAKSAIGAGVTTGLISGVGHGYKWWNGEESAKEAITNVLEDSALSGASMYVSTAVVQKIGNKTVVTALIDGAKNHTVGELAGSAVLNHGVATFVSDGTRNVYHFMKGDISKEQFIKETAKSAGRSVVSGGCAAVAVCIANTVLGPHIVTLVPYANQAIATIGSMAGGWVFDKVSNFFGESKEEYEVQQVETPVFKDFVYEKVDERNFFFIEDVLGNLPLEMQKGITAFNSEDWQLTPSVFDDNFMNRPTAFNTEDWQLTPSAFDDNYMNRPTAFNTEDWIIRNGQYENK